MSVILMSVIFFALGYLNTRNIMLGWNNTGLNEVSFLRIYKTFLLFTVFFSVFSVFDFFIVKGGGISGIVAMRETEHITGARNSLIGALVALMSGAPPLMGGLMLEKKMRIGTIGYFATISLIFGFFSLFLSGGRNGFFIGLIYIFVYYLIFIKVQLKVAGNVRLISKKSKLLIYGMVFFGVIYSLNIFVERFNYQGMEPLYVLTHISKDYNVDIYIPDSDFMIVFYVVAIYLLFYVTHAFNYLDSYFVSEYSPIFMGAYNFPIPTRFLDLLLNLNNNENLKDNLIQPGVYLTLPGSLYLDFGYVGSILFVSILSFCFGVWLKKHTYIPLYKRMIVSYIGVLFLFSPIYSVLGTANGFSILLLLIIVLLSSIKIKKIARNRE